MSPTGEPLGSGAPEPSRRSRLASVALVACILAGCSRHPAVDSGRGVTAAADSTRPVRQRIAQLEAARSFGDGKLQSCLQHADARVRRAAVVALGRIQDPAALPALRPMLDDSDSTVADAAAFAIGQLQGLEETARYQAAGALFGKLDGVSKRRAPNYIEALGKIGGPESIPKLSEFLATGLIAGMGSEARPPLQEGLAALAIARIKGRRAAAILADMGDLQNREPAAAWRIGAAMAVFPDTTLRGPLRSLLRHSHKFARAAAARAMGKRHDRSALPQLLEALSDLDWEVRASALQALGELHVLEAASYCEALAADAHPLVREAALVALDSLQSIPHEPLVRDALRDRVPAVRLTALRVLAQVAAGRARDAFEAARADSAEFVRTEALRVASRVQGEPAATALLLRSLADRSVQERVQAATALGELRSQLGARRAAVRAGLERALHDDDFVVAASAAEAIGKLGLLESVPALAAAYDRHRQRHSDVDVRLAAVSAGEPLAKAKPATGKAELRRFLTRATSDSDTRVVQAARTGLAAIAGEPAPAAPPPHAGAAPAAHDSLPRIDLGIVRLRLVTAHGEAILSLDGDRFPRTVGNFLRLVDSGFYRDGVFHRVVPAFVVQGGDPRGDGWGDAGYFLPCEYGDLRYDDAGVIGMAHSGKDTGGTQFFITHLPVARLDGRYTAFGRVEKGLQVVNQIVRGDRFRIERAALDADATNAASDPPRTTTR